VSQEGSETNNGWQNDVLVPLQTPFRMITWAAPKFSSQASQFVPVPPQKPQTKFRLGPTVLAYRPCYQLTDSEYAECEIEVGVLPVSDVIKEK